MEPVEISGREMYDAILALTQQVTIMVEKIDMLCETTKAHERRISSLEERRWPIPVLSVVIPLIAVALTAVLTHFLGA